MDISVEGSELLAWLMLMRDCRWNRRQKRELISAFESVEAIYQAPANSLHNVVSGRKKTKVAAFNIGLLMSQASKDLNWVDSNNASLVPYTYSSYSKLLAQVDDPPLALFAMGDISLLNEPLVGIVGSRRPTPIGAKVTRQISQELSELGIVIVSGMALGVDGLAHQGALDRDSATVAVMGCGLDVVYPSSHKRLFEEIQFSGLLISEYPPGMRPSKYTFPERNRIVSGLSMGVVIIEAAEKSGTLITSRLAMEQNREVMVLPGSALSSQYRGSHQLIKNGAALVTASDDVLFILKNQLEKLNLNKEIGSISCVNNDLGERNVCADERALMTLIGAEPVSVESLILSSGLTAAEVSSMLLMLELKDQVAISDDGGYVNIS